MNYRAIKNFRYVGNCTNLGFRTIEKYLKDCVRANKREIERLVKIYRPDLHYALGLDFHNPYNYYRTDKHLILTHSSIEYFFEYEK